jgi:hypothetical protein
LFRVDASSEFFAGTGLGLAVGESRSWIFTMVLQAVESEVDRGTTVTLRLPQSAHAFGDILKVVGSGARSGSGAGGMSLKKKQPGELLSPAENFLFCPCG